MAALSPRVAALLTYANLALACIALSFDLATLLQALLVSAIAQIMITYLHWQNATDIQFVLGLLLISAVHFFVFPLLSANDAPADLLQFARTVSTWGCYAIGCMALLRGVFIVLFVDGNDEPPIADTSSN